MPASVLYMSMSLDGYIAGPDDEPGNPGGDGFGRLHEWYGDFFRPSGPAGELHDDLEATGAVLVGQRSRTGTHGVNCGNAEALEDRIRAVAAVTADGTAT